MLGDDSTQPFASVELEFKELPYFIVSRSKVKWDPSLGDVNLVTLLRATEVGLVVDPEFGESQSGNGMRQTLIPWTNVISLSITRADEGAKGTQKA